MFPQSNRDEVFISLNVSNHFNREISKPLNLKSSLGSPTRRHQVTFGERQNSKRKSYTYDKKDEKEKTPKKVRHSVASKSKRLGGEGEKTDIYMNPHKEIQ